MKSVDNSRGSTSQLYLGKYEVSLGRDAFHPVTDFTTGKITQVIFPAL